MVQILRNMPKVIVLGQTVMQFKVRLTTMLILNHYNTKPSPRFLLSPTHSVVYTRSKVDEGKIVYSLSQMVDE